MTTVETLVYSGRPNPTFTLDAAAGAAFATLVQQRMAGPEVAQRPTAQLGYSGFAVTPDAALGLPPFLTVGQGLVVGETGGVTTAWTDTGGQCEALLKQHASGDDQERLVEPDRGDPAPPEAIRPQGRRLDLPEELLAAALDFARGVLAELEAAALVDVPAFAAAAGKPGFVDGGGAVAAQLGTARTRLGLIAPSMAAGDFAGAARHVAVLLSAVDAAALKVGGLPLRDLVVKCVNWAGVHPLGLALQLGLPAGKPDGLRVDGTTVVFALNSGAVELAPAPILFGFDSATLEARLRADASEPAFSIGLAIRNAKVGIGAGPLSSLLGGVAGSIEADLALGVDSTHGLTLSGGASKKLVLPAHTGAGPFDIREITLEIPDGSSNTFQVGASVAVKLGPVDASVEGAGITLRIDPNAAASGQSPLAVDLKAPTGIGLSLDAGIVRGGGFLEERSGGYGGALQLRVGPVEVQAFGLLTLKPSFALVVVMSVRFTPAIDLSFGFTLNAVGGVVGIEHRLDGDALAAQVSTGALEHILFPPDAVAAAPSILDTLEQVFPLSPGSFVIGPMLEIGWGRPVSFITAQIGVILSLPDPKIAIIGRVRIALPAPELPIVDLRATVVGEVDSERFFMRVSLVGSRIAGYPIYGDIGVVMRWSGGAEFALSAGGFHPRYSPPRELCNMQRLGMDMSPPAVLRLRSEAYFALTSNSVQLGARIDLSADLEVASIDGHFQFDALVVFAPHFLFLADLGISLSVRAFGEQIAGVIVQLHLEGAAPWRAEGHAEVEIWWSVSVDVGPFTWGDATNPPPEPVHPRELVHLALDHNPGAWQALAPLDADRVVRLKPATPSDVDIVVHPIGLFEVRQRALPLETVLARVGPNPVPDGERRVYLGLPTVGAVAASAVSDVADLFAAANFLDLSDDEKLSRPGFEPMSAGVQIRPPGEAINAAAARDAELRYETFVCDDDWMVGIHSVAILNTCFNRSVSTALASGSAGASALRASRRYSSPLDPLAFSDAGQVTRVSKSTVTMVPGTVTETYTHAAEHALEADVQFARVGVAA